MRIIGGRDYYDSAMALGQDSELVFVRQDIRKQSDKNDFIALNSCFKSYRGGTFNKSWSRTGYSFAPNISNPHELIVIFAGKAYYGFGGNLDDDNKTPIHIWTYDNLIKYTGPLKEPRKRYRPLTITPIFKGSIIPDTVAGYFTPRDVSDITIPRKISIAVLNRPFREMTEMITNEWRNPTEKSVTVWNHNCDGLKELGFQTVLDPWTAFQELSMYIGNLPSDGPPMIEITDNIIKAEKHGFDKWSFRKKSEKI